MTVNEAAGIIESVMGYEGTELEEQWGRLLQMFYHRDYSSNEFEKALEQEVIEQAKYIQENFEFAEEEVVTKTVVKRLVDKE